MKTKKIPMRLCIGCGEMKPKKELLRILRDAQGGYALDTTGKLSGRGAYICADMGCLERARKSHAIERSFRERIPQEIYEEIADELRGALAGHTEHMP